MVQHKLIISDTKYDNTQKNIKGRLWCDGYETVNHKISECSRPEKIKVLGENWVEKLVHWELCMRLNFSFLAMVQTTDSQSE